MMELLKKKLCRFAQCERGHAFVEFALSVSLLIFLLLGTVELSRYVLVLQKLQYAVNKETNIISSINQQGVVNGVVPVDGPSWSGMAGTPTLDLMLQPYTFENVGLLIISDIYYDPANTGTGTPAPFPNGQPTVEWRFCSSTGTQGNLAVVGGDDGTIAGSGLVTSNPVGHNGAPPITTTPAFTTNLIPGPPYGGTYSKFGQIGHAADLSTIPTLYPIGYMGGANGAGLNTAGNFNPGDEIITAEIYYYYTPAVTSQLIAPRVVYVSSISVPRYGPLYNLVWSGHLEGNSGMYSNVPSISGSPYTGIIWTNCY